MKEREISLLDLLVEILLRWRGFVIWMVVGALLFGAFSFVNTYRISKAQEAKVAAAMEQEEKDRLEKEATEREQAEREQEEEEREREERLELEKLTLEEQLKAEMTPLQVRKVKYTLTNEVFHSDKLAYQERSLLMHLDPNSVKRAEVTFYISSGDRQRSHDIEKVYEDIVRSGEAIAYIADEIGCEAMEIAEGVSLNRGSSGMLEDTNTFRLSIVHYNESDCLKMVQAMIDFVQEKQGELEKTMGAHQIMVINQSYAEVLDTTVLSHQRSYLNDIEALEDIIVKNKEGFTEEEWNYYDFLVNGKLTGLSEEMMEKKEAESENGGVENDTLKDENADGEESPRDIIERGVTVHPGISIKYVLLGMLLMAFLYAFIIFVLYVLNTRLRETDQLQDIYDLTQLGMIPRAVQVKKPFGFVDQWILSLRNRNKRHFTKEKALELATVAVKIAAGKASAEAVCLMGCDLKGSTIAVCESIKDELEKEKIQVNILNNVLYDAQAMRDLEHVRAVVLVEGAGTTLYGEIAQELELMHRQDIKVLGGIVVA